MRNNAAITDVAILEGVGPALYIEFVPLFTKIFGAPLSVECLIKQSSLQSHLDVHSVIVNVSRNVPTINRAKQYRRVPPPQQHAQHDMRLMEHFQ